MLYLDFMNGTINPVDIETYHDADIKNCSLKKALREFEADPKKCFSELDERKNE